MSLNCNPAGVRNQARLLAKLGAVIALAALWLAAGRSATGQDEPEPEPETETAEPVESEQAVLPKLEEMEVPTAEELLTGSPRDWIILKNSDVIVCEPIVPRPNTLELRQQEIDRKKLEQRGKEGAELTRIRDELNDLRYLEFTIPEDVENPEYRIEIIKIDRFLHHEDLMLLRIDRADCRRSARHRIRTVGAPQKGLGRLARNGPSARQPPVRRRQAASGSGRPGTSTCHADGIESAHPRISGSV